MPTFRELKIIALGILVVVGKNRKLEACARVKFKRNREAGRTNSHNVKTKIFNSILQQKPGPEGVKGKVGAVAC